MDPSPLVSLFSNLLGLETNVSSFLRKVALSDDLKLETKK